MAFWCRLSRPRAVTILGLGLVIALATMGVLKSSEAFAEDCSLTTPLMLADTQDGFAGQVGTVWTIEPDCSFTVARQLGPKVSDPYRQGRLTPEQQKRFGELLAQAAILNLPERLGNGPMVNARRIALSYEGKTSILFLPPGDEELATLSATLSDDAARHLAALAEGVNRMTAER